MAANFVTAIPGWLTPPPWPDQLFTPDHIEALLKAGKARPPFESSKLEKFANDLNAGFRSAWHLQIETASSRQPPKKEQKADLEQAQKHAEALGTAFESSQIRRTLGWITPELSFVLGGESGIDPGRPENYLALLERLNALADNINTALPPRIAEAVLAEYAERKLLNIPPPTNEAALRQRESAQREAVSAFLLGIAPAVLQGLAARSEIARRLLDAEGNAKAGQKQNHFAESIYSIIGSTYKAMFGRDKVGSSKESRENDAHPMNRFIDKLREILSNQLSDTPNDEFGAIEKLRDIIALERSSFAQYIYKSITELPQERQKNRSRSS